MIYKFDSYLTLSILFKYKLNDIFVIGGKKFNINNISADLQTGKSKLELINTDRILPSSLEKGLVAYYKFDDANFVRIAAVPDLDYQTIVALMDATHTIVVDGRREILFPQPILGQIAAIVIG